MKPTVRMTCPTYLPVVGQLYKHRDMSSVDYGTVDGFDTFEEYENFFLLESTEQMNTDETVLVLGVEHTFMNNQDQSHIVVTFVDTIGRVLVGRCRSNDWGFWWEEIES
jgi:hypothetical protein